MTFLNRILLGLFLCCVGFHDRVCAQPKSLDQEPLIVYVRDSFYKTCAPHLQKLANTKIRFISLKSSLLMARLRREKSNSPADLVIGTDTCFLPELKELGVAGNSGLTRQDFSVPIPWESLDIIPFCYGYLGLLYKASRVPKGPKTLQEILSSPLKIVMSHPRTSTVGLVFCDWLRQTSGPYFKKNWSAFQNQLISLPKGLSQAFALFMSDEADLMVAYTTSTHYAALRHPGKEVRFIPFDKMPFHGYTAFVTPKGSKKPVARALLKALLREDLQKALIERDSMYPVQKALRQKTLFQESEPIPDHPVNEFTPETRRALLKHLEALSSL